MRRHESGNFRYTTADLTNHLSCPHLTALNHRYECGSLQKQSFRDEAAGFHRRSANVRMQRYLQQMATDGIDVVSIDHGDRTVAKTAADTLTAMQAGSSVIYGPTFLHGQWESSADFLMRVDGVTTDLGDFGYEVFNVNRALVERGAALRPATLLRLADPSEHVHRLQGVAPRSAHIVFDEERLRSVRIRDVAAWARSVKQSFTSVIEAQVPDMAKVSTAPPVVTRCGTCDWLTHCEHLRSSAPAEAPVAFARTINMWSPKQHDAAQSSDDDRVNEGFELSLDLESLVPEARADRDEHEQGLWLVSQMVGDEYGTSAAVSSIGESLLRLAKTCFLGRFPALERSQPVVAALLRRSPTKATRLHRKNGGHAFDTGAVMSEGTSAHARRRARELHGGYLTVTGPPGSGKTTTAAQIACDLAERGERIGLAAPTPNHALHLLRAVRVESLNRGQSLRFGSYPSVPSGADVMSLDHAADLDEAVSEMMIDVAVGVPEDFARDGARALYTALIVDEAGMLPLAHAVAMMPSARNVVLLGTVSKGAGPKDPERYHPKESVLEHLAAEGAHPRDEHGVNLELVHRVHPILTKFLTEQILESPARSHANAGRQWIDADNVGVRFDSVASTEDHIDRVTSLAADLVGRPWTDAAGFTRTLRLSDLFVISTCPTQTDRLKAAVGTAIRVGGPDDFAGEHAPVVIGVLGTPAEGADVTAALLPSRSTVKDMVERAECVAVVVGSAELLSVRCETEEDVRRASVLNRLAEVGSFAAGASREIERLASGDVPVS